MSSFINMMASDRWSEQDIVNRTEAMIAAEFPPADQVILNRKVTAAAAGMYELTDEEKAEVTRFNALCLEARQAGEDARADMRLLEKVLDFEAAQRLIAGAAVDVLDLVALRNPPPAPIEPAPLEPAAPANDSPTT